MSDFKERAAGEREVEHAVWGVDPAQHGQDRTVELSVEPPSTEAITYHEEEVERACACGVLFRTKRFTFGPEKVLYAAKACPTCRETWPPAVTEPGKLRGEANLLQALNIPPRYADVTLANYRTWGTSEEQDRQTLALRTMGGYISRWPQVPNLLVLQGPPGTGKGHFLWSVVKAITLKVGQPARVVKLAAMVRDLRASWRTKEGPTEDQRLAAYRSPLLLGIDEVSRHAFYGEQIMQHLYDVLDDRLEWMRPTILTTNEGDEWLQKVLGAALVDRLQGDGGVVECNWRSFRSHGTTP